jgi:hypothetical protein
MVTEELTELLEAPLSLVLRDHSWSAVNAFRLIIAGLRDLALRRAMLAQNMAGKPLGDAVLSDHTLHASTTTRGA